MRRIALLTIAAVTMLPLTGFAQQAPETVPSAPTVGVAPSAPGPAVPRDVVPEQGGPLHPAEQIGRDIVADDGVSTKTVRAAPCTTAARETDGTTTCVGIPGKPQRQR
jgi:hypothetical protein